MRRFATIFILSIFLVSLCSQLAWAGKVDILIKKLVEKGIITQAEAQEIIDEIQKEAVKEEAGVKETKQEAPKRTTEDRAIKVPKWVEKMDLKGDLRLRYEYIDRDFSAKRDRGRFRWRLGVETEVADKVDVGFGLASGGDDPRSTNQSLGDTFSSKNIVIDYGYAQYTPFKWLSLLGGKVKNPLYRPGDLLWDSDIRPEGAAVKFNWQAGPNLDLFLTPGFFVLDEIGSSTKDPIMYAFQPGLKWKIAKNIGFQIAGAAYGFRNVKGNRLDHSANTNTLDGGVLNFDYDSVALGSELGFHRLGIIPYLGFFGEFIKNPDPDTDNEGFLAGFMFGYEKVKKFGQWRFKYNYRHLEKDAWLDVFPDSDFFDGTTNAEGHEGIFDFGLAKNVKFTVDYYNAEEIRGTPAESYDRLQLDLNFKF